jgi:hypothetical protein
VWTENKRLRAEQSDAAGTAAGRAGGSANALSVAGWIVAAAALFAPSSPASSFRASSVARSMVRTRAIFPSGTRQRSGAQPLASSTTKERASAASSHLPSPSLRSTRRWASRCR